MGSHMEEASRAGLTAENTMASGLKASQSAKEGKYTLMVKQKKDFGKKEDSLRKVVRDLKLIIPDAFDQSSPLPQNQKSTGDTLGARSVKSSLATNTLKGAVGTFK